MKIIKICIFTITLATNTISHAFETAQGNVSVYVAFSVGIIIQLDTNNSLNPGNCSKSNFYYLPNANLLRGGSEREDESFNSTSTKSMETILLNSKYNNESVILYISDVKCLYDWPTIVGVQIP